MTSDDELRTVADFDAEIERLQAERERLTFLLADPEQRQAREAGRDQVFARWVRGVKLTAAHLDAVRKVAGDRDEWMFEEEWLAADGWVSRDEGGWTAPPGG